MATNNLQTDLWDFEGGIDPSVSLLLATDQWYFDYGENHDVELVLSTDRWDVLFGQSDALPAFTPSLISAVARVQQGVAFPKFIMGGLNEDNEYKLFKYGTGHTFSLIRSSRVLIPGPFKVTRVIIPLKDPIEAGMQIVPVLYFNDSTEYSVGAEINVANYPNGEEVIYLTEDNFNFGTLGQNDVFLELRQTGSVKAVPKFPIVFELETIEEM